MSKPTHSIYTDFDGRQTITRGIEESTVAVYSEGLVPVEQLLTITGIYTKLSDGKQCFLVTINGPALVIRADGSKSELSAGTNVIVSTH